MSKEKEKRKSFHLNNDNHAKQLAQANDGLMMFAKFALVFIAIVWLCRDVTQPSEGFQPISYHAPYDHNGSTLNLILDWF